MFDYTPTTETLPHQMNGHRNAAALAKVLIPHR